MKSTPVILFRFHRAYDVCAQNIRLLKRMNPEVPLYGLYGGMDDVSALPTEVTTELEDIFKLPFDDPYYNWMHGDICARWWYKQRGKNIDFTHLVIAEWDMLFLRPIAEIYQGFAPRTNYGALAGTYEELIEKNWPWIQGRYQRNFDQLVKDLNTEKPLDPKEVSFGIFGGCVLCREFLDAYASRPIKSLCNDEVRLGLYAKHFDIPVIDNGFLSNPKNIINADDIEYTEQDLAQALKNQAAAIHPIRKLIPPIERLPQSFSLT